jgi:hypothetical protein
MRSQIMITIDTGCRRKSGESEKDFQVRVDQMLTLEVNAWQKKPAYENWDLLSVAPFNKQGVFLSTWEYDPELHEDVKSEGIADEVDDYSIGRPAVHLVRHGDTINVNGELFTLSSFEQFEEGARVGFVHSSELMTEEGRPPRVQYAPGVRHGVSYNGPRGMGPRYRG